MKFNSSFSSPCGVWIVSGKSAQAFFLFRRKTVTFYQL